MPYPAQTMAALLAGIVAAGFVLVAGGALAPPAGAAHRTGAAGARHSAERATAPVTAPPSSAAPAPTPDPALTPAGRRPAPERLPTVTPRPVQVSPPQPPAVGRIRLSRPTGPE